MTRELVSGGDGRSLRLYFAAQALGGASSPIVISLGGIVGQMLAHDPRLATLPVSLYNLGVALATIPAALLVQRVGRRSTYMLAAVVAVAAACLSAAGIAQASFRLFCAGTAIIGFYGACVQSYRFAAADAVAAPQRPTAISRVMLGGLIAAVIGPQTVIWTREMTPGAPFMASFVAQAVLAVLALAVLSRLAPAPQTSGAARVVDLDGAASPDTGHEAGSGVDAARPLAQIVFRARFMVAVLSGVVSFGFMSFIMTAAPMAMVACGHSVGVAALGIQWHVLAMFAPGFFTGRLIESHGKPRVINLGFALMALSALVALSGLGVAHFWFALVLLGVGWNLSFIGATALVTECHRQVERSKVQACNDLLVFGSVALASFGSGVLLHAVGWDVVNLLMIPALVVVMGLVAWLDASKRVT